MEEADALADRAGIMAKRMLAMGTSDDLRQKHGNAYHIHLVLKSAPHTTTDELEAVTTWIKSHFSNAELEEKMYHGQMRFSVPVNETDAEKPVPAQQDQDAVVQNSDVDVDLESEDEVTRDLNEDGNLGSGIGPLITILEAHREELGLEHYSVSPTTLDQVFLTIVGKHNVEEENYEAPGGKKGWGGLKFW